MLRTMIESGKEYAIIPMHEYENLLANTSDDNYDEMLGTLAEEYENDEAFPISIFTAIESGSSPIKIFRIYRNMSLAELAKSADLSSGFLSQLENGKRQGTTATLKKIANSLDIDMSMIIL